MVVSKKSRKSKNPRKSRTPRQGKSQSNSLSTSHYSIKTLSDLKSQKSLSTLSSVNSIKSDTTIGELYNLTDINENINKLCIHKLKNKKYNNIQLDTTIAKKLCQCIFEKNSKFTIEQLENKIKQKLHTPGSECIKILDKFIKTKTSAKQSTSKKSTSKH